MSTLEIIVGLMHKRLSLATEQLRPEQTLEELGVDSLALIEFMFDVEDALNIRFDDERVVVTTVQDVVNLVDLALDPSATAYSEATAAVTSVGLAFDNYYKCLAKVNGFPTRQPSPPATGSSIS